MRWSRGSSSAGRVGKGSCAAHVEGFQVRTVSAMRVGSGVSRANAFLTTSKVPLAGESRNRRARSQSY
jgi:hypothetical protein